IETQPSIGTTVSFWLPLVTGTPPSVQIVGAHTLPAGSGTILIVEDEEAVRNLSRRVLVAHGYKVLEAGNGEDALQVWRDHAQEIDVLITDVVMPKIGGPALVERLRIDRPELAVIFCSGYSDNMLFPAAEENAHTAFLGKPFTLQGLLERVGRLTGVARATRTGANA
ncbi:MAG: response regulator, partial [Gemmatimonadota bacterium]|nr:response regulator [Gemmatimonadota bacterium]